MSNFVFLSKKIFFFFFFLSPFFASSLAFEAGILVVEGIAKNQENSFLEKYDVRVLENGMGIVIGSQHDYSTLLSSFTSVSLLSKFKPEKAYFLIERTDLEYSTPEEIAEWAFSTLFTFKELGMKVVYGKGSRYLVSTGGLLKEAEFSAFLPETEFISLPTQAIRPLSVDNQSTLAKIASQFAPNDKISELVAQVDTKSLTDFDKYLTGERNDSSLRTRNSFSEQVKDAATWIGDYYSSKGFSVEYKPFSAGYGPNVIATFRGTEEPEKFVIIGAHFDSRATDRSSPTQRAPGGNDDGSGTSILLEISRLIAKNNLKFKYSVILGSWCGEEQGLVGSRAYALECRRANVDIVAMLQGDMLAYRKSGEKAQCAFPDRYHDPALTTVVKNVIRTYVPQVTVCDTSACCSDQQSFHEQGYSATFFFERCGSIADGQYHREGDLVERTGFNLEQWTYNAQAMFASLLTLAQVL